jgi:predicted AAA+ superfamily ATPase
MKYLTVDRIVVLKGVRRGGKSTLMFQMAQQLLADSIAPRQIVFVDFEDFRLRHDVHQIIDALNELYGGKFLEPPVKYLFLDEVHHIEHWESAVKVYFDRKRAVKFIVLGSSSPLVQRGSDALIGRCLEEKILPISFQDFLLYYHEKSALGEKISQAKIEFAHGESLLAGANALTSQLTAMNAVLASYLRCGGFAHVLDQTEPLLFQKDLR